MPKRQKEWKTKTAKRNYLADLIKSEKDTPTPYKMQENFEVGEFIEHPKFGQGFIQGTLGAQKVAVFFEDSEKVLLQNWAS